jgi:hypothetical protein
MAEFFRGWKRKVGVVTLCLGCVFMLEWVRSASESDLIHFMRQPHIRHTIYSCPAGLGWTRLCLTAGTPIYNRPFDYVTWQTLPLSQRNGVYPFDWHDTQWGTQWMGFRMGTVVWDNPPGFQETTVVVVPHWSIVIPLTLLSAWLLLSKPRRVEKPDTT